MVEEKSPVEELAQRLAQEAATIAEGFVFKSSDDLAKSWMGHLGLKIGDITTAYGGRRVVEEIGEAKNEAGNLVVPVRLGPDLDQKITITISKVDGTVEVKS